MIRRMLWLIVVLMAGILPAQAENPPQIQLDFQALAQGNLGRLQVSGENIVEVHAAFLDHQYLLQADEKGIFEGLVTVPIESQTGLFRLSILVIYRDGTQEYFAKSVRVNWGEFPEEIINLPLNLQDLSSPEYALDELDLLAHLTSQISEGNTWDTLTLPPYPRLSSRFGLYRRFNATSWERHTGIDYPNTIGTPVPVIADGIIALVQTFPIRGNYILVDHGGGLFSGYAHLSAILVEVGDTVQVGDLIGEIGSTGRSSGPHLHLEIALSGAWVDPLEFAALVNQ